MPPTMPPDTPWWAWLAAVLGVAVISASSTWLVNRPTAATLKKVAKDTAATAEQTVNQHSGAEYPNLRDELTAVRGEIGSIRTTMESVRSDIGGLHSETRDLRKDVTGIRTDARQDRRNLAEHLADVPRVVEEAMANHATACPARLDKPTTP